MFEKYSNDEKAQLFDEIANHYFNQNFGFMSKTNYETLLFKFLLDYLRNKEPDRCSDYQISKVLGISQSRVRNIKLKVELMYPRENFNETWKEMFTEYISHAKYDEHTGLVKMNIPDITVLVELRNFMEEKGWYDEYQLNPKLFQCPIDIFLQLCQKIDENASVIDENVVNKLKELKMHNISADEKSAIELFENGNIKEGIVKLGKKVSVSFLEALLDIIPFGNCGQIFLKALKEK